VRRLLAGACLLAAAFAASAAAAAAAPQETAPQPAARAWLVQNADTGEVLAASAAREHLAIASITKLMTVLVTLDRLKLSDVVTVDGRAAEVGQESIYLRAGEQITVRELVEAALIQSANNAADALALAVAPDFEAFARLMNAKAAALGMKDTHFVRPDGLDATGAYSSAHDVTVLAQEAMRRPFVRSTVRQVTAVISGNRELHTWNDLLGSLPGVIGVKTGHTSAAGWSQVAAVRADVGTIYVTILGAPSRAQRNADLQRLLVWGVSRYRIVDAIVRDRAYAEAKLPFGRDAVALVASKPLRLVVRPGRPLVEKVVAPVSLQLPAQRGQAVGRVEIWSAGRLLGRSPLVVSRAVARPGLAARIGWYAGETAHNVAALVS
jgi:D-alanyl-D-alanine carboxypeptidase (penicillin-binding protein 5/6)